MHTSNKLFSLPLNKTIATQENLLDIHECINQHLCHEKTLSKIEILNYLMLLNNMEFPNHELQMVAQYAENICIDILRTLNISEDSLQNNSLSSEIFKTNTVSSTDTTKREVYDNIISRNHDTKTSSLLFPSQSTAGLTDLTLNKKRRSDSFDITSSEKLLLDIQQNLQFDNNTLQIPSEMLTNNNFGEEIFQGDCIKNCDTVTCDNEQVFMYENHQSDASNQTDICLEEKKLVDNVNIYSEREKKSIQTNTNLSFGCFDEEQTDHSFVFDLDNGSGINTNILGENINKDIDQISERLKGSVSLYDDDINIISETPNQSPVTELLPKSRSQSRSLLNIYGNSYKKKTTTSRFLNSRSRLKKSKAIKKSQSSTLDFSIDGSSICLTKNGNFQHQLSSFQEKCSSDIDTSISQNKVIINGSEIVNTQEISSEDSYVKDIEDRRKQVAQQRFKYHEKWKNMSVEEKVNMKFIRKFDINIFEAPVDVLLNIEHKMRDDHFYFPRITKEEMNNRLKQCNIQILIDTLVTSIKEAANRKLFKEIRVENNTVVDSSDEDNESHWLKEFVEQSKLGYINKGKSIKTEYESVINKEPNTTEGSEDNLMENNEKDLSVLLKNVDDFNWLN